MDMTCYEVLSFPSNDLFYSLLHRADLSIAHFPSMSICRCFSDHQHSDLVQCARYIDDAMCQEDVSIDPGASRTVTSICDAFRDRAMSDLLADSSTTRYLQHPSPSPYSGGNINPPSPAILLWHWATYAVQAHRVIVPGIDYPVHPLRLVLVSFGILLPRSQ